MLRPYICENVCTYVRTYVCVYVCIDRMHVGCVCEYIACMCVYMYLYMFSCIYMRMYGFLLICVLGLSVCRSVYPSVYFSPSVQSARPPVCLYVCLVIYVCLSCVLCHLNIHLTLRGSLVFQVMGNSKGRLFQFLFLVLVSVFQFLRFIQFYVL